MSNEALINALAKEESKLVRQEENHEASKAVVAVIGDSAKEAKKRDKQLEDIAQTKKNIAALKKAIK